MSDPPSEENTLPVVSPRQNGLALQDSSLVKRGLELVAKTASGRRAIAHSELTMARRSVAEAEGACTDPEAWDAFVRHSRDAWRHGLLAVASYLGLDRGEGSVELAQRLVERLPGLGKHLPNYVARAEYFFTAVESDRERARQEWESLGPLSPSGVPHIVTRLTFLVVQRFVESVASRIEPPVTGSMIDVVMPELGRTIIRWNKTVGEAIDHGEGLFEVALDTADVQIPSPVAGTLVAIFVQAGEPVPVNTLLATIRAN